MTNLRVRPILRWDAGARMLRLVVVSWEHSTVGDGEGYSAKLSVALRRVLWRTAREGHGRGWLVEALGVRVHCRRSYGGRFP